jgi:hypothetical protein
MKVKDVKDIIKNIKIDAYSNEDLEETNLNNSEVKNTEEDKYNVNDMLISALENVEAHEQYRTIHESVVTPEHEERKESTDFKKAKKRLKDDGHYKCWVCGSTNNLQAHHYAAEWSLADCVDFDKLKAFCEEWDPYGYGKLLKDTPITSVDDVRNMLILCLQGDAKVLMADNTEKPIKDIKKGDEVIGGDGLPHRVLNTFSRKFSGELIEIAPETFATPEHPVWTKRGWIPAGILQSDDFIYSINQNWNSNLFRCQDTIREFNSRETFISQDIIPQFISHFDSGLVLSIESYNDFFNKDKEIISLNNSRFIKNGFWHKYRPRYYEEKDIITYDIEVENINSFWAGGVLVHNCQLHHTGVDHENDDSGTGIHSLSFSAFIIQKIAKDGENPIPQPGQDADDMIKLAEKNDEEEKDHSKN